MKSLDELIRTEDPAWPTVSAWIESCPNVCVLPTDPATADAALLALQVTLRSPMGALVHHTGGLLVDHGWLRILGAGGPRMRRSLPGWTTDHAPFDENGRPGFLLIADDVMGGFFALNGGGLGPDLGHVLYFSPQSLDWEDFAASYSAFLTWALSSDVPDFYRPLRWPGWERDIAAVSGDQALSVHPFLWLEGIPSAERTRRPIPVGEKYQLTMDVAWQISNR
ncbi:DUF2625 family protein [Mitsuaria sp. 7]|uniref:DUF2625 family protein n=1 Tax=Mitsuaria sp. 7 TaxID=1658665 RepID=UPI0007DDE051|nr:DUF2625 family protein [Mitsuaria sp. 7]ANH67789.1 hypothetical protein ABE85_09760 [Mitsuaria sp. 7]